MTNLEATTKAKLLLINNTVDRLAEKLGISKPTLYTRLSEHNWKLGEKALLEKL
jgi:predicted DNA binding protein